MKSGKKQKRRAGAGTYHHGDLRRALIDEAARLASGEGAEAVSLRRVAAGVRVSHTAPYHHFKNKADLLAAVADEGFRIMDGALARAAARVDERDPDERLRAMGRAYVRFAERHPHYFRVMFRPELAMAAQPDPDGWSQKAFMRVVRHVQAIMGRDGEPTDDVMEEVLYAWCVIHGLASLWVDGALAHEEPYASWGIRRSAKIITRRADVGRRAAPL